MAKLNGIGGKRVNISKTVQGGDILTTENYQESYMTYQMAATAATLNYIEGHSQVVRLFKCNPSSICPALYTISTDSMLVQSLCVS